MFLIIKRKTKAQNKKTDIKKILTQRELSQIEKLEKDMAFMRGNIQEINKKSSCF